MTPIYSIISTSKDEPRDQYVMAVSYNKELLENMVLNIDPTHLQLATFHISDNTPIYSLKKINYPPPYDHDRSASWHFILVNTIDANTSNLYAWNKITSNKVDNVLLDVSSCNIDEINNLSFIKNNMSEHKILFDFYYDEGIMNA